MPKDTKRYCLYVTLDSPETAIDRVADRVKKGGHGVDEDLIRKRYDRSKENLKVIAEVADNVLMFDNSKAFTKPMNVEESFSMIFVNTNATN